MVQNQRHLHYDPKKHFSPLKALTNLIHCVESKMNDIICFIGLLQYLFYPGVCDMGKNYISIYFGIYCVMIITQFFAERVFVFGVGLDCNGLNMTLYKYLSE